METAHNNLQTEIITALVYGIIFLVLITTGIILFFHASRKKLITKERQQMALQLNYKEQILQNTIQVQENERKRIAQDLHDAISAKLNVISLSTHMLLDTGRKTKKQQRALQHILEVTTHTLESSRKLAHQLMPPVLDKFGLKVALQELFDEFTSSTPITINSTLVELPYLSKDRQLHVFRIMQELINNALTHGQANVLEVHLKRKKTGFTLLFTDNGLGFNVNKISKKPGIGLQNIKSRVAILKGEFTINSTPKNGSCFTIVCNNPSGT